MAAARLPDEPGNLEHTLIVDHDDITAKLTWNEPHVPVVDPPVTGYEVTWGPVLTASHHSLLDDTAAERRELPRVSLKLAKMLLLLVAFQCHDS